MLHVKPFPSDLISETAFHFLSFDTFSLLEVNSNFLVVLHKSMNLDLKQIGKHDNHVLRFDVCFCLPTFFNDDY